MEEKKVENEKTPKRPTLLIALIPILGLILILIYTIGILGEDPHIALLGGACIAAATAFGLGYKWEDIEQGFLTTINMSMQACIILMLIGCLIGAWIMCGTVPAMIYYGLQIISPGVFLPVTCIICSIVSLATGSSWSTAGTVGVALLGIGNGLGMNTAFTAGAIISGAYFGDKMSPLSDTTNLAPAVAGSTLFEHIRHMVYTTGPSYLIALVLFTVIGLGHGGAEIDQQQIQSILDTMQASFTINPLLLLPPVLVVAMVVIKMPAIPGIVGGTLFALLLFFVFQSSYYESMQDMWAGVIAITNYGFVSETGHELVDSLLSRGGLQNMMWSISIVFCAMIFGGIMEVSKCLEVLAGALLSLGKGTGSLVLATILSCFFINLVASDQYLAIVIPGRMYASEFRKRGLHPKNLSRCLEDSGTLTSPLIPWNSCGGYMSGILGISPLQYAPFAFLNWINPLVSIFYGFTGITIEKLPEEEMVKVRAEYPEIYGAQA